MSFPYWMRQAGIDVSSKVRPNFLRGMTFVDERVSFPLSLFVAGNLNYRGGSASDGCLIGTLTPSALAACIIEDNSAGTFVDETTDINDAGTADIAFNKGDTSDAYYFGCATPFFGLKLTLSTAGVGDAVAAETLWEYYNGSAWVTLETGFELEDDSAALTTGTSTYLITFNPPSLWSTTTVNSQGPYYYIRMRCTADAVYNGATAVGSQGWVLKMAAGTGVYIPFPCTLVAVNMAALTASATNDDTEFLFINVTQGTWTKVTWTGADVMDRVASLTLAFDAGDELAIVQIQEDGSTEFANANLVLELQP